MQWSRALGELLDRVASTPSIDGATGEGKLNALSASLSILDDELREQMQAATASQLTPLLTTLESDGPVAPKDLELIRLWLVGDAEHYVKMETDVPAWQAELNRLLGVLRQLRAEPASASSMARMGAAVRDALRVASDIAFYREQQERIRAFDTATQQLTRQDNQIFAGLLRKKLTSPDM